ncbi:unnamed protein product [Spirodela intermedia]|uniref:Uncharacterized protein n=2 Tax=Spirodela intermedia TaxID=51605 RepID=A0A7I8IJI7_SPIIN|nr:unnamed protein product [Spirodela intermedia]CAA6657519.1 unnamed protein product [Spirodela intermedia]CAA7393591.1 unnamed protein product [Spirodela intermedia]
MRFLIIQHPRRRRENHGGVAQ